MIKVGIIGCGKIADVHAALIQEVCDCEIVGVCDKEELMAKQLYERFEVKHYFDDVNIFLQKTKPDIVHIATPAQSHFELGKICLEAGCHVYIEKPFMPNTKETEKFIKLAVEKNLKITAGHDDQFSNAARRMRDLIRNGYLGGDPIHMESYYCYDLGDESYAKAMLGDKDHFVYKLPGKLLHNIISHGVSKIAEFLKTDNPKVIAHGFTSSFLKNMGVSDIVDELRVIISENDYTTAYFTVSTQMRPVLKHFRIYGPQNALFVDHDNQTIVKVRGSKFKSYLDKFIPPLVLARQYAGNSINNIHSFLKKDFHMKGGMKFLIESFYRSIFEGAPLPIPYREILLTSRIMDSIFSQINSQKSGEKNLPGSMG